MKKILLVSLVIVALFVYFFVIKKSPFLSYTIEGKKYKLMTAKNYSEWTRGLMNYRNKKELKGADGMIFIFPEKDYRQFWNQKTYLDLDVYWISGDEVVGKDKLPSIEKSKNVVVIYSPNGVDKVVEIVR